MNSCKVCGYSTKESLKHALFFVDPNVTVPFFDSLSAPNASSVSLGNITGGGREKVGTAAEYTPSVHRVQLVRRRYVQDECTQLLDVPNGDSVLTIRTDPAHPDHSSSLSHIVIF